MGNFLLCATPARSHMAPMVTVASHLCQRGHRVRLLAGRLFEEQVKRSGAEFVALPPSCDFDDRDLDAAFPGREKHQGLARLRFDIDRVFADAMIPQSIAVRQLIDAEWPDAVLADVGFMGLLPLLMRPAEPRPPFVTAGLLPLQLSSRDTAPFGLGMKPSATPFGRLRNGALGVVMQRTFRGNQRYLNQLLRETGARELSGLFFDGTALTELYLQFCSPSFEYPRSDLPTNVRFVGPILPGAVTASHSPRAEGISFWPKLDDRPVVLVTQGTVDNLDLGRLVGPTLSALAELDLQVIATTGGRPISEIPARISPNVHAAEFVPFSEVLPRVDVLVTNGGYGGVNQALAYGVPLVVAGDSEDKPEVAARVAWSKTGINLRTGNPKPLAIRRAVEGILADDSFRQNARRLADEIAQTSALDAVADALTSVSLGRGAAGPAGDER